MLHQNNLKFSHGDTISCNQQTTTGKQVAGFSWGVFHLDDVSAGVVTKFWNKLHKIIWRNAKHIARRAAMMLGYRLRVWPVFDNFQTCNSTKQILKLHKHKMPRYMQNQTICFFAAICVRASFQLCGIANAACLQCLGISCIVGIFRRFMFRFTKRPLPILV